MKQRILFEDSSRSPISNILTKIYGSDVIFCETCDTFSGIIRYELDNGIDLVVCYFDSPPDNAISDNLRRDLEFEFCDDSRVVILRSQAIEHYVIKALSAAGVLNDSELLRLYKDIELGNMVRYKDKTYEKFCKRVLNSDLHKCVVNKMKFGSWYYGDCCQLSKGRYRDCVELTLYEKIIVIMWALPYYPAYDRFSSLRKKGFLLSNDPKRAKQVCEEEYYRIQDSVCSDSGNIVRFDYMLKDIPVAHIDWYVDEQSVHCTEYQDNLAYQWFGKQEHNLDNLMDMFECRCFDRNRYDIKEILEYLGLPEYSPYHICLKTHGVSTQDYMWIRWKGETLTWDDVKIRK